ncbi:MAG: 2Fe-2S iron-sulfur cluster binding domain-containing protein [Deltaproteobacteria bacterium]|nr:2Fe-2S iron-sulfur cluster binding domain-containing protein [Deltaproteobacteria bacterium]
MIRLTIDGKRVEARNGEFLLALARREGIEIPTLCHHEAVEPAGACRLCMVEVTKAQWNGFSKLVTACLYPAEEGLVVRTDTERVMKTRREVLELLLARSPRAEAVRRLARQHGITVPKYNVDEEGDNCILCDICTRVCSTLVTGAIARVNRGVAKKVATPFDEASDVCVGCLSCARSCPTEAIAFLDDGLKRTIWGKTFDVVACSVCGAPTVTKEHPLWMAQRKGVVEEDFHVCDACKVGKTGQACRKVMW